MANFGLDHCEAMETTGADYSAIVAAMVGAMGMEDQPGGSTGTNRSPDGRERLQSPQRYNTAIPGTM